MHEGCGGRPKAGTALTALKGCGQRIAEAHAESGAARPLRAGGCRRPSGAEADPPTGGPQETRPKSNPK
ncbi:MAG: hypothetical protein NZM65_09500 [Flavobacteriales bacterium]|nr:hypothetical protein [Flavobacteriales bacterium]MDW8410904.1 hypothetical protein [Flavobacteriales bacterium]